MAAPRPVILYNNRRRAKRRIIDKIYSGLVAAPQALTGGAAPTTSSTLTLPTGARLGVAYSVGVSAGQLQAGSSTGRTMGTPALAAGEIHEIGYFGQDVAMDLEITAAVAGTATLYQYDSLGEPRAIATAIFT